MSVGVNATLIAIGSVLAFAVDAAIAGIDIFVLGWLLIGAGVLGLILKLVNLSHRGDYSLAGERTDINAVPNLASPAVISNVAIRQSTDSLG